MRDLDELRELERRRDIAVCGRDLSSDGKTRFADAGAHDPTPTHYFVLEDLFARLGLKDDSRLLDVGCGAGRALAYFVEAKCSGCVVGVELDGELAAVAADWTPKFSQVSVLNDSALEIPLAEFTHFYLFNPFDSYVLERFVQKLEADVAQKRADAMEGRIDTADGHCFEMTDAEPSVGGRFSSGRFADVSRHRITLCHMSDNGESYFFWGRPGWHLEAAGEFQYHEGVRVFDYPQHWSIWEYEPET